MTLSAIRPKLIGILLNVIFSICAEPEKSWAFMNVWNWIFDSFLSFSAKCWNIFLQLSSFRFRMFGKTKIKREFIRHYIRQLIGCMHHTSPPRTCIYYSLCHYQNIDIYNPLRIFNETDCSLHWCNISVSTSNVCWLHFILLYMLKDAYDEKFICMLFSTQIPIAPNLSLYVERCNHTGRKDLGF